MGFEKKLKECQKGIEKELISFFKKKEKEFSLFSPSSKKMISELKEFTSRPAKRIRPILVLIGFEAVNGKIDSRIVKASIALELLQSYLLIHDDVMDQSITRRGKKSFHKKIESIYFGKVPLNALKRFSENEAIIAGDLTHSLAVESLIEAGFDSKKTCEAVKKLMEINKLTAVGQELDILLENSKSFKEKDVLMVQEFKTAKYTIDGPLQLGAILAGASKKQLTDLSSYAVPTGIAFQIHDDMLGLFGSKTGKSVSDDLTEGKKTLLAWFMLNKAKQNHKKQFLNAFNNSHASQKQIAEAKKALIDSGALEYSELFSLALIAEAFDAIEKAGIKTPAKNFLIELSNYLVTRKK
ncbi:MAG: polyprenyl synthetase family protein [Candidatus Diapherotrites archaeon]